MRACLQSALSCWFLARSASHLFQNSEFLANAICSADLSAWMSICTISCFSCFLPNWALMLILEAMASLTMASLSHWLAGLSSTLMALVHLHNLLLLLLPAEL